MLYLRPFLLFILLATGPVGDAQEVKAKPHSSSPEKVLLIKDMLAITGTANLANQILGSMIQSMKPRFPDIPETVWDRIMIKMHTEDMIETMVEIHGRHFSMEELQIIVTFYKSPTGQRMIKELPTLMSESMTAGQEWGKRKGAEIIEELKAEQTAKKGPASN